MLGLPLWQWINADNRQNARKIVPAVQPDKLAIWVQGGYNLIDKAARNFADRSKLGVAGAPVVNANSALCKAATNFLRSAEIETDSWSAFAYCKSDGGAGGVILGSFLGAIDPGMMVYYQAAGTIRAQASQGDKVTRVASMAISGATNYKRFSIVCNGLLLKIWNETDGTSAEISITAARYKGKLPINIGSSQSVAITGFEQHHAVVLFRDVAFTDDERAKIWAQIMPIASAYGITENSP